MAGERTKMKRVLFYGSIEPEVANTVEQFLHLLIPRMLSRGYRILTREGTSCPERYSRVWLDNLVLDVACAHRDRGNYPMDTIISLIMAEDCDVSGHNRTRRYLCAYGRFEGYSELLNCCDAVVAIGGTEGVYRLGLFAASKEAIFIPLSFAGGRSKSLVRELRSLLARYGHGLLDFMSQETHLGEQDIEKFLDVLDVAINEQTNKIVESCPVVSEPGISRVQLIELILSQDVDVPRLPIGVVLKLLPTGIVAAIIAALIAIVSITAHVTWTLAKEGFKPTQIDSGAQKRESMQGPGPATGSLKPQPYVGDDKK